MSYTRLGQGNYSNDSGVQLYCEYQLLNQSSSANTSTIRIQLVGVNLSSSYGSLSGSEDSQAVLYLNGNAIASKMTTFDYRTVNDSNVFFTTDATISHDSSGNASFTVSGTHVTSNTIGSASCSGSATLPQIKRQATLNSVTNFKDTENPVFNITNSGNYYMMFWLEFDPIGGESVGSTYIYRYVNSGITGKYTFSLTESERNTMRSHCTDSNKMTVRCGIKTSIGGVYQGATWLDRTMTITDATPTAPEVTITDTNSTTVALTGAATASLIKGYSDINVAITTKGTGQKYATISSYEITNGTESVTISESTSAVSGNITSVESADTTIKTTDSRGNNVSVIETLTIISYEELIAQNLTLTRASGGVGTSVTLGWSSTMWSGSFGAVNNSITEIAYKYKLRDSETWTDGTVTLSKSESGSSIIGDFDVTKTYDFSLTITDKLSTSTITAILGPGQPAIKITEDGKVIFKSGYIYVEDSAGNRQTLELLMHPVGSIISTTDANNPSTYWGGTWESYGAGRVMVGAGGDYTVGSTGGEETHKLTKSEMPSHSHTPSKSSGYFHCYIGSGGTDGFTTGTSGKSYSSTSDTGGDGYHNNMQPYVVVYLWRRTA